MEILKELKKNQKVAKKTLALLIDPDKYHKENFEYLIKQDFFMEVGLLLVGGSLITQDTFQQSLEEIKKMTALPVIIFPGSALHISSEADAILLLSLISGRNPEFLIGQHVVAAPMLKNSGLQILPTAYMLIEGGKTTTVSYISNTTPIPSDKPEIAATTAMAGEMLGLQMIYLDAGSGATEVVSMKMIHETRKAVDLPIIIGGGIRTPQQMIDAFEAGADIVVIGNILEKSPELLKDFAQAKQQIS